MCCRVDSGHFKLTRISWPQCQPLYSTTIDEPAYGFTTDVLTAAAIQNITIVFCSSLLQVPWLDHYPANASSV